MLNKILFSFCQLLIISQTLFYINNKSVFAADVSALTKCHEKGFCHRNRKYASNISKTQSKYYKIIPESLEFNINNHSLTGIVQKQFVSKATLQKMEEAKGPNEELDQDQIYYGQNGPIHMGNNTNPKDAYIDIPMTTIKFPFSLDFSSEYDNLFRFQLDEERLIENKPSLPSFLELQRYNKVSDWSFENADFFNYIGKDTEENNDLIVNFKKLEGSGSNTTSASDTEDEYIELLYKDNLKIEIFIEVLLIRVYYKSKLVLSINDQLFLNVEHLRKMADHFENMAPEEFSFKSFKDASTSDKIPFGPEAIALDFTFENNVTNVYGIPEHSSSLRLKETTDDEPYRLFNTDVFKYPLNSTNPSYGAIPFMFGVSPDSATGIFWNNAADTRIDIKYDNTSTLTHWMSESGTLDFIIICGDGPQDVIGSFTDVTGKPALPLLSSIGYHQCRWNYYDEQEIAEVNRDMDIAKIPYDFIWLDIDYTDSRKYFTWDSSKFPDPERMLRNLNKLGRNLVTIIDPHLKTDYEVSNLLDEHACLLKNSNNEKYIGQCWPGDSVWIDTFKPEARDLWSDFYQNFTNNDTSISNLHMWNDMNEVSIFGGPETTSPLDNIHYDGVEERSVHNLYGLTVHEATYNAMKKRYSKFNKRPFVLTRSFFAGSQRSSASWTGDNAADWEYLKWSIPMVLTANIAGYPFIGADIAGFFGNPSPELMVRWYQTGIWYPFFRGHAHIDSDRREPYLLNSPYKEIVAEAIRLRYQLLPTFYTLFQKSSVTGAPIMAPLFYKNQDLSQIYNVDDEFYIGGLLLKPITSENTNSTVMLFPKGVYYNYTTFESFVIKDAVEEREVYAPLDTIPVFIEGGNIIFRKDRYRRSSKLMVNDPYTLLVAPDIDGNAYGDLYVDDGETFNFNENNEYLQISVELNGREGLLKSSVLNGSKQFDQYVTKIILPKTLLSLSSVVCIEQNGKMWESDVEFTEYEAVIKNPKMLMNQPWSIKF
ncbi:related to Glucosidase 2 subunit alpha [Saccharomycodes ludwigii]|uniref:Glucosidase II subunit alpha n=1 Tax=Saccharomycodes ludwigii TaxID=36035 RepID=A0A376B266_9ASCO|nr:hypothetical protein SCDLUD_000997 [Saccharomycodes ludwigii]KAH3903368.1 hypothetical protein SCDLUD_000997 [Saccharomycodes ludwigii]SSD58786.1 related to Glucosidase 2 subunit alpha [Saccharomycodes ludwigii]